MIIDGRFNGPPTSAHGGWVAGALASQCRLPGPVTVTLRQPPPLNTPLDVETTPQGARLLHAGTVLATAASAEGISDPVPLVDPAAAEAARRRFLDYHYHPFPGCFVCGPAHPDGLAVYSGPVSGDDWTHVAAPLTVPPQLGDSPQLLWAVLDCPGGWAAGLATRAALLASYTVLLSDRPGPAEACVVVAHDDGPRGRSGRARATRSAVYGADGRLLGQADAVWVGVG